LEDQEDPEKFMEEVRLFNATYKEEPVLRIEVPSTGRMYEKNNVCLNYGYKFLEAVYSMLEIDRFINRYIREKKIRVKYDMATIFKFLVLLRVLNPCSKRGSYQVKENYYGMKTDFELEDIYRAMDKFADFNEELQRHLNSQIKKKIGRDLSYAFYDVTNYFCEIDFPHGDDDLRQTGPSKERRLDPIISMGLFMDNNALPLCMSIFSGNTSEQDTLEPIFSEVKRSYGLKRLIVVADKGLNSAKNLDFIQNKGYGYVFSQALRGTHGAKYQKALFDPKGYISNEDGNYKYKLFEEEYDSKDKEGNEIKRKRKVLIYWDARNAKRAARKR
jgi:transposase